MRRQTPIASIKEPINLRFGSTIADLSSVLSLDSNDDIRLRITTKALKADLMTVEVSFSPRMITMLFCQSIILQTRQVAKALISNRVALGTVLSRALQQALERGQFADGAWTYGESWPDADFKVRIAQSQFLNFFQACAEFRVDRVRCKLGPQGIELQDRIVFEHFQSYEEWKQESGGGSKRDYRDSLEDDAWSVSFPIFTLGFSYSDLIAMIDMRLRRGLTQSKDFYDAPFSGQWADLAVLLTGILCRLPNDTTVSNHASKTAYSEIKALGKSFLTTNKVCARPPILKFRRALPRSYKGLLLAL